ncbi:MAG: hybrid sensor histidine kinase/response regulator [Kangiellaceae bacterium]|nr:hybrid sensor histidine kinase/response regulator [Kangiellaceae bacterium]
MLTTPQIIAIAFAYVCLLFFIAYISDKNKPQVISANRKALVYSFSLAIYCTSWTFYGAVGSAAKSGWGYLPIYLGPILIYTIGWPLMKKFIKVGYEQNTTSISDFIASRFGKSQSIAAIVTIIAVIAIIPYIALQLKAITMSIGVFDAQQHFFTDRYLNSLFITLLLIVFSILFGTRNLDVTEHQYGMMNAIAFESVIKLVAFCAIGLFALYSFYDGPISLISEMVKDTELKQSWFDKTNTENFITQTILAGAAIFCLPRQFHVSVVEYHQSKDLSWSRWIFPIYLSLISIFVIPIVVAGSQYFVNQPINADTYILALPIAEEKSLLSAIVFIGGLSAATGMVIVATVALSTMISNDLVLPIMLHNSGAKHFKDKLFNRRMLLTRRIAIASCLILSYGFYRLFDDSQSLASIGYLSFSAVFQFVPALVLGLFWSRASRAGAITGLIVGIICWFVLTWIPSVQGKNLLDSADSLFGYSLLTESLLVSFVFNLASFYLVSLLTQQSLTEKVQAYAYTREQPSDLPTKSKILPSAQVLVRDLKSLSAAIVGKERMVTVFEKYSTQYTDADLADKELLTETEKLLSASIGAASARVVILSTFKEKGIHVDDVINLLSSTSQALRFNRRLIEITMDNISQGVSVSDIDKNIIAWNSSYQKLMNYPKGFLYLGIPVRELIRFNAERGFCGPGSISDHIAKRVDHLDSGLSYRFERERNDGLVLEIVGNPLPQGGYVTTYTDISEYKKIESALKENERQIAVYTDNSPAALAYLDKSLIFRFCNKTFALKSKMRKEDIVGTKISEVLAGVEVEYKRPFLEIAFRNNKQQFEYSSDEFDSPYYLVTYIPDVDSLGNVRGIYSISQDISNRRKAELALKEVNATLEQRVALRTDELHSTVNALELAKAEAEKANQSKSRFLAAASHDLLQPFNAARLFSELLKSEKNSMTDSQAELIDKADQSLSMAEAIIHSLIDISKLDSGRIHPAERTFNIRTVLDSLERQFSEFAEQKSLGLKILLKDRYVRTDSELLYRILQNFVSNAIRYTNNGRVLVSIQNRKELLRVSVWDTGIGIEEQFQSKIFEEFKQLSDSKTSSSSGAGLGLGLSISERLAAILNLPIEIHSTHGKGTVFHIYIPLVDAPITKPSSPLVTSPIIESPLSGTKVLCVDNEIQITDAMSLLLNRWGCEVRVAQSEEQLGEIFNTNFQPDILVVDYQLDRGKTGIQFIQSARKVLGQEVPAIIVTADHTEEVENEVKRMGLLLLYKPLKPAVLRATMNSELGRN